MFISLEPSSSHLTENTQFCWVSSTGHMGHWVGDHSLTQSHSPGRLAASDSKCRQAVDAVPSSSIVARSSCRVNKLSDVLLGTGHSAAFMTRTVMVLSGLERNKIYTELAGWIRGPFTESHSNPNI